MSLKNLSADLILIHPPAYFDFRNCREVYFPFLGTSGDVPITPLYEYFPVGFKSLQMYLEDRDYKVKIINLSSLFVQYPGYELDEVINALDTDIVGIDLHWMIHVQGALAIAENIRKFRKDILILFGGISSTYYADELIRYSFVDMVLRGYDTHQPLAELLRSIQFGMSFNRVPNLLYKSSDGEIFDNGYSHKPEKTG